MSFNSKIETKFHPAKPLWEGSWEQGGPVARGGVDEAHLVAAAIQYLPKFDKQGPINYYFFTAPV
jgi:hypothetical protein